MTNKYFPAWPPREPFPETDRDSIGDSSPDFPQSGGLREMAKFRPSRTPKLTTVAVANDDGSPLFAGVNETQSEMVLYLKAITLGLTLMTGVDLIEEVS